MASEDSAFFTSVLSVFLLPVQLILVRAFRVGWKWLDLILCVAIPVNVASEAFMRLPVRPRNKPQVPGVLLRNHEPPTSGYRPIVASGMASMECSVTMR